MLLDELIENILPSLGQDKNYVILFYYYYYYYYYYFLFFFILDQAFLGLVIATWSLSKQKLCPVSMINQLRYVTTQYML